ncbi:hypothetical protein SMD22_07505 [Brevibacillus halotolerans]|nr:hypothetical protein SMD22_07505 [Brevibacillus halotolerans]
MSEVKVVIKDCIFESVMMGADIAVTLRNLHFVDGFKKEDILEAFNEMVAEAQRD